MPEHPQQKALLGSFIHEAEVLQLEAERLPAAEIRKLIKGTKQTKKPSKAPAMEEKTGQR